MCKEVAIVDECLLSYVLVLMVSIRFGQQSLSNEELQFLVKESI